MIIHRPTRNYVVPVSRNKLAIQFVCQKTINKSWRLVYWNRFSEQSVYSVPCHLLGSHCEYDHYICELTTHEPTKYLRYYFAACDDSLYLSPKGVEENPPKDSFEYLYTNENDILEVPEWAKGAIIYQIFPERFCNGDRMNDPVKTEKWNATPTRTNFFGGDIQGIISKLDYLETLNVDVIYLTPIFKSPSNHKYDTEDYLSVDPSFGTLEDLRELTAKCHEKSMHVILDGVFNHCGYTFAPFQDVLQKGENSAYRDWFFIDSFPVQTDPPNYECVGYYKWMPKMRMKNREVRDFFLHVGTYWVKEADIDGWRLDVADEVDFTFWQEYRRAVKAIKPDALLLGETWKDGQDMLRGDQLDSVMNYLFRNAVISYFKDESSTQQFDNSIQRLMTMYPQPAYPVLYNLIGSHDTERFLTLCGEDIQRLKLAVAFQMTFPGMPAVYYGDEIGMTGENDPDCRKAMEWDKIDEQLYSYYKSLASLRRRLPALRFGSFKCIHCGANTYGFARQHRGQTVYVLFNRHASEERICVPAFEHVSEKLHSLINGKVYSLSRIEENDCFYRDDSMHYQSKFNVVLPAHHVEIIKSEEEVE